MKFQILTLITLLSNIGIPSSMSEKIHPKPKYMVIAPRLVRPAQTVLISVSIYDMPSVVYVHSGITRDRIDVTSTSKLFHPGSTGSLQLMMPENAGRGQYRVWVKGSYDKEGKTNFFQNETEVHFQQKHVSVFLQLDKAFYQKRDQLKFRLIAVTPNLMPVKHGSVTVYLRDGKGRILHRFFAQQLLNGVYEDSIDLWHPVTYSQGWSLQAEGWGYKYRKVYFEYENNFPERLDINISCPTQVMDNDYAISGLLTVNQTSGMPAIGNATVELEIQPPGMTQGFPVLKEKFGYFSGVSSFLFPLSEVRKHTSNLTGTNYKIKATVQDYHILEKKTISRKTRVIGSHVKLKFIGGRTRVFKPGAPLNIWIAVFHADGTKLRQSNSRQLYISTSVKRSKSSTSGIVERPYIIPDDSIVRYTYTPPGDATLITVRASFDERSTPETLVASRHYTPSDRYIMISTSTIKPKADRYMVFTVRSNVHIEKLDYLIMSKGQILVINSLFMKSKQKTFSVAVSRDMTPFTSIVIYGLVSDGEVLTDSMAFHVTRPSATKMSLKINLGKDLSRDRVELSTTTEPGTYVAFSAVPYELYKAGANRASDGNLLLTTYLIEEELETYSLYENISSKHTWYLEENKRSNVYFPAACSAIDANTTFLFVGLSVYTDAHLPRLPAVDQVCNATRGTLACYSEGCYESNLACDNVWQCEDGVDEMGCPEPDDIAQPDEFNELTRIWSHLDSSSWAWKHYYTKPDGRLDLMVNLPLRPRTWAVGGFALSLNSGLIFVENPAMVDTTRQFHAILEMQNKAKKGEQLGVQISLFNYWHRPLEVLVTLLASNKYDFVNIGDDSGWTNSYAPRTTGGRDIQTMVYLEAQKQKYIHFPILPKTVGKFTVKVHAETFTGKQEMKKTVTVSMDGVTVFYHSTYFIDLINHGSLVLPNLDIPIREMFVHPDNAYHFYVPGSQQATVSLVGDVMGPGFFKSFITQDSILDSKEGHGETYLFDFAYNVFWLRFLKVTDQESEAKLTGALKGLRKILQPVFGFITPGGCFAMRRKRAKCSTWMTSYALDILSEGVESEWQDYLFVDTNVLNELASYIISMQDVSTGAFRDASENIYDNKLWSPNPNAGQQTSELATTAFATMALAGSVSKLSGPVRSRAESSALEGASYLAKHLRNITDPFQLCLVTYALTVAGHPDRDVAFHLMRKQARIGEYIYWSPVEIPAIPTEMIQTVPYLKWKQMPFPHESKAIQATSYALMVYLRHNMFEEAIPIVSWLQTRRSTDYAFDGPQDTTVAIRALKEFGESINNRQLFNLLVDLEVTSDGNWKKSMHLKNGSLTDYLTTKVPVAWGSVRPRVQGTGYALLQLSSKVNVEYPFLMRQPTVRSFDLNVEDLHFMGRNASIMFMNVCVRWVRTDIYPRSGAATLRIDIPTGFVVRKREIRRTRPLVRVLAHRPRFTGQQVVLYLDYFDDKKSCFEFYGERWYPVANVSIQHRIQVIDTYEPAFQNTTLYTTFTLHHLHICQVCGSFQCPYCPYYNTAASLFQSDVLSLVTLLATILTTTRTLQILGDIGDICSQNG